MPAVPKTFRPPKPRQPLKKSRIKQGKGNPFPQKVKTQMDIRDEGRCRHPGCWRKKDHHHHISNKKMGSTSVFWIHDERNGVCLCDLHHILAHGKSFWRLFWEAWQVHNFGWWAGESMNVSEWIDRNELRLQRTNIDVRKLVENVLTNSTG